jgi:hypothetical protein
VAPSQATLRAAGHPEGSEPTYAKNEKTKENTEQLEAILPTLYSPVRYNH